MARVTNDGISAGSGMHERHIDANGQAQITLPDADFIRNAELTRDGQDLIIHGHDGQTVVIDGYFGASPAPLLTADGLSLSPDMVRSFAHHEGNLQYADNSAAAMNDASPVGAVKELTGGATVTHPDGSKEAVTPGMAIHEGDVIETAAGGAVNIMFIDQSTFAISQNARVAIDEYVFDPSSESGSTDVSVLRGMFVYTSGLIGREDPDDVTIHTPQGSIGIRGTIIAGNTDTGTISVLEGAIVLRDFNGNEMTLDNQFETAQFNASGTGITSMGTGTAAEFSQSFSQMRSVAPDLFNGVGAAEPGDSAAPANNGDSQPAPAGENHGDNGASAPNGTDSAQAGQVVDTSFGATDGTANFDSNAGLTAGNTGGAFDSGAASGTAPADGAAGTAAPAGTGAAPAAADSGNAAGAGSAAAATPPTDPAAIAPQAGGGTAGGGGVTPTGNHIPVIGDQTFHFTDNSAAGSAQVIASDTDTSAGQTLTYEIASGNAGGLFQIDSATGLITLTGAADYEAQQSYDLIVKVTDSDPASPASAQAHMTIQIDDANDTAPIFSTSPTFNIDENKAAGAVVGQVAASDPDTVGTIAYSIVGGDTGGVFSIDAAGNIIVANAAALDYETNPVFTLTVQADDGVNTPATSTVTVNLNDLDDVAPALTLDGSSPAFTEGSTPLHIAADAHIADSDSATMQKAVIKLANPQDGTAEGLSITAAGQAILDDNGITISGDGTATITLSGAASAAVYESLIKEIVYNNASDTPNETDRIVNVTVSDGTHDSTIAASTVSVTAVDDDDTLAGTSGSDTLAGDNGNNTFDGGAGNDTMTGGSGNDTFLAADGDGSDTIDGGSGSNTYDASAVTGDTAFTFSADGSATAKTGSDTDQIARVQIFKAGSGNDTFLIAEGDGSQTLNAGGGTDTYNAAGVTSGMNFDIASGTITAGSSTDTVSGFEKYIGGAGADTFHGTSGNDDFSGGDGNDTFIASAGDDTYDGGNGSDTVDYSAATGALEINLLTGTVTGMGTDHLSHIEHAIGSGFDDTFYGSSSDDTMEGGNGNDTFHASAGNDAILGGAGNNTYDAGDLGTDQAFSFHADGSATIAQNGYTTTAQDIQNFISGSGDDTFSIEDGFSANINGGAGTDTLTFGAGGNYDTSTFGTVQGIEKISASGNAVTLDLAVNAGWFDNDTNALTIDLDADDALNLDFSTYAGVNFTQVSDDGGTVVFQGSGGQLLTVNYATAGQVHAPGIAIGLNTIGGQQGAHFEGGAAGQGLGTGVSAHGLGESGLVFLTDNGQFAHLDAGALSYTNLPPEASGNLTGGSIAAIGDFNGDGSADYLVGLPYGGGSGTGAAFVMDQNGTTIAQISGFAGIADGGASVAAVGDVNHDGYADILVGAPGSGGSSGAAYLLYGNGDGSGYDISSLTGNGLTIAGSSSSHLGQQVQGLGDINGDGYNDFALAAPGTGAVEIVLGGDDIQLATDTIQLTGISVSGTNGEIGLFAGDFNGDGINDVGVSGNGGQGEVNLYYGGSNLTGGATPDATLALAPNAHDSGNLKILAAGSAGDFNGDGADDMVIVLQDGAANHHVDVYVLHNLDGLAGQIGGDGLQAALNDPANALHYAYDIPGDVDLGSSQFSFNIGNAGDVNGDGYGDVMIGMPDAGGDGSGSISLLYGHATGDVVSGTGAGDTLTATQSGQVIAGLAGNDMLSDGAFSDLSMLGGAGDDLFQISTPSSLAGHNIDGGAGKDTLALFGGNLDFSALESGHLSHIEVLSLSGSSQNMTLSLNDIFSLLETSDTHSLALHSENETSTITIDNGGGTAAPATAGDLAALLHTDGGGFDTGADTYSFHFGGMTLEIDKALVDGSKVSVS
jgi:Ca2+-binding RTX toxin-like protein